MTFTKKRIIIPLLIAFLLLLFSRGLQVFAGGENNGREHKASISLCLRDPLDDSAIKAGRFSLYKVAVPAGVSGEDQELFAYTADFHTCGIELKLEQADLVARQLALFAGDRQLEAADQETVAEGRLSFSGLADGLYLIVQEGSTAGYYALSPFLVTLPMLAADGSLIYELEAKPKIERLADPEPPRPPEVTEPETAPELSAPPETEPGQPEGPEGPGKTDPADVDDSRLIQTGQLNWPLPLLATAGFLFFAYGWQGLAGKKDEKADAGCGGSEAEQAEADAGAGGGGSVAESTGAEDHVDQS
ncbi:MAG: hypothetical protein GX763_01310 [Clostridiaceae bacterium]|nr:hypothetical protein [Clostridiaceae bacterium]